MRITSWFARFVVLASLLNLYVVQPSSADVTLAQRCQAAKLKAAAKKSNCRLTSMAKQAMEVDVDLGKCSARFDASFVSAEVRAGAGVCPTEHDVIAVGTAIDANTNDLEARLSGVRFVDNGDGTVTDNQTGLQWEQKVPGSGCLHCADDVYAWTSGGDGGVDPDGDAFTKFLGQLNACASADASASAGGFAGHCDWRLPTIAELLTIYDETKGNCGGTSGPCIDSIFVSSNIENSVWSSTSGAVPCPGAQAPCDAYAWNIRFDDRDLITRIGKGYRGSVRAVRALR
jgi:hypothetical protein